MATTRIEVRFHLAQGKNFMKWQVKYPDRKPEYYDPKEFQLVLGGCTLKNNRKTAEKIFAGAHKTVCAKVLCDHIAIYKAGVVSVEGLPQIKYNPRVRPNWMWDEEVMDGCDLHRLISDTNKLYYDQRSRILEGDYILRRFLTAGDYSVNI
jgi:hypothetical protein